MSISSETLARNVCIIVLCRLCRLQFTAYSIGLWIAPWNGCRVNDLTYLYHAAADIDVDNAGPMDKSTESEIWALLNQRG